MTLAGTLQTELELKSPADKFFKRLSNEIHHTPNASSDKIHAIEVHEGDWETPGSVKLWTYTVNGKKETFKEKIEVDEAKKSVTLVAMDGHVLEKYKSYKVTLHIVPKGEASVAKITLDFEKHHESHDDPNDYLQFVASVARDVDEHLASQAN